MHNASASHLSSKIKLIKLIQNALTNHSGFSLGKIGFSEQFFLNHPMVMQLSLNSRQLSAYQLLANVHCLRQSGVFPTDFKFLTSFSDFFSKSVSRLDVLGLFGAPQELEIISRYQLSCCFLKYQDTEPDRSIPNNINVCYLPLFKNKRVLLIAPFAHFLQDRAQANIFESVWQKTKKPWFDPLSVDSIEFPYAYELKTQKQFGNVLNLYEHICQKIDAKQFDVALIAAGALAIPLADYIKSKNKIALSLGGHLQVLFGVKGARWKNDPVWPKQYFTPAWVDMPATYHPSNKDNLTDAGAYW